MFLPPDLKSAEERNGRPVLLLKYVLLLAVMWCLIGNEMWRIVPIATHTRTWLIVVSSGIVGGLLMLATRQTISLLSPRAAQAANHKYFLRGSYLLWLSVFLIGGFAEEFWRALCVHGFQQNGYSVGFVNVLTALAFGIAHLSGLPSRVSPGGVTAEMTGLR